jgi:flagellar protein FlaI
MSEKGSPGRTRPQAYQRFEFRKPKHLIQIPHFDNLEKVSVRYPLLPPHAHAEIKWSPKTKTLLYSIIEPVLTRDETAKISQIEDALREVIDVKLTEVKKEGGATEYLQEKTASVLEDLGISLKRESYEKIMYYIVRDFVGLNEIESLMHDPYIEDIGCNGLDTPVYIVHRRFGSVVTNITYRNPEYLSDFVVKIAERCGRYISYASPLLDGSLPDGSRVQASLAKDVTTRGPTFSIRKFRSNPYSPVDLINLGTVSPGMMAYLWILAQYNVSMLICGGVSTGKTTFLNALSMFIPPEDKIISIEDTREINLPHDNWIPSVSRTGFGMPDAGGKRYGEIDLFDLLRESFRQNPSYVVVGEVRGKEAYVMFQGMASGHASLGTIHAGSIEDVMKRLETPPIELSPSLIEALDVLIVMTNAREKGKSARRVKEIVEVQSIDPHTGRPHTKEIFSWIASADEFRESTQESEVMRKISFEEGLGYGKMSEELGKRKQILKWMQNHSIVHYADVCRIINMYYKDPRTVMDWVRNNKTPFTRERIKKAEKTESDTRKSARRPRKPEPPVPKK